MCDRSSGSIAQNSWFVNLSPSMGSVYSSALGIIVTSFSLSQWKHVIEEWHTYRKVPVSLRSSTVSFQQVTHLSEQSDWTGHSQNPRSTATSASRHWPLSPEGSPLSRFLTTAGLFLSVFELYSNGVIQDALFLSDLLCFIFLWESFSVLVGRNDSFFIAV